MKRFFSKILFFFFIFLLFFIFYQFQSRAFAEYKITADPESPEQPTTPEANEYLYGTVYGQDYKVVTENTKTVHINFSGLVPSKDYFTCLSSACLFFALGSEAENAGIDKGSLFKDLKVVKKASDGNGEMLLHLCADGEDTLKLARENNENQCEDKDKFWGGHVYSAVVSGDDSKSPIDAGVFYVSRYYPQVIVSPQKPKPGDLITITIKGTRRNHSKGGDNRYAVGMTRAGDSKIKTMECLTVPNDPTGKSLTLPSREAGDYIIFVAEGKDFAGSCLPGFVYYGVKIRVRNDVSKNNCKENQIGELSASNSCLVITVDPGGQDIPGAKKDKPVPPPPCETNFRADLSGTCPSVKTAVGSIGTKPEELIRSIFSLVLGVSGGIALLLIIYSGYQLMASQGNPEKLQAARDQLVAAIIGLVFIIFSLVILQIIGVDILKIPHLGP